MLGPQLIVDNLREPLVAIFGMHGPVAFDHDPLLLAIDEKFLWERAEHRDHLVARILQERQVRFVFVRLLVIAGSPFFRKPCQSVGGIGGAQEGKQWLPIRPSRLFRLAIEKIVVIHPGPMALMDALQQTGVRLRSLQRIFTGSEVLDDHVRIRARSLLGVDISDNYGSTEAFIAWQCPSAKYHINSEHVFMEIVDEQGAPTPAGEMGRVLVTTLQNNLMPLVRYEIGDYAVAGVEQCRCGRTPPNA
jgi:hypothetical protein